MNSGPGPSTRKIRLGYLSKLLYPQGLAVPEEPDGMRHPSKISSDIRGTTCKPPLFLLVGSVWINLLPYPQQLHQCRPGMIRAHAAHFPARWPANFGGLTMLTMTWRSQFPFDREPRKSSHPSCLTRVRAKEVCQLPPLAHGHSRSERADSALLTYCNPISGV